MLQAGGSSGERFEGARKYEEPAAAKQIYLDWGPQLPETYSQDILYGLVRDPRCIFFYWELTGPRRAQVEAEKGSDIFRDGEWVLVIANLETGESNSSTVGYPLGNFYAEARPLSMYVGRIGWRVRSGEFICFAETPPIRTPAEAPSGNRDAVFISDEEIRKLVLSGASEGVSSLALRSSLILSYGHSPKGGQAP